MKRPERTKPVCSVTKYRQNVACMETAMSIVAKTSFTTSTDAQTTKTEDAVTILCIYTRDCIKQEKKDTQI